MGARMTGRMGDRMRGVMGGRMGSAAARWRPRAAARLPAAPGRSPRDQLDDLILQQLDLRVALRVVWLGRPLRLALELFARR